MHIERHAHRWDAPVVIEKKKKKGVEENYSLVMFVGFYIAVTVGGSRCTASWYSVASFAPRPLLAFSTASRDKTQDKLKLTFRNVPSGATDI